MYMGTNNRETTFKHKLYGREPEKTYHPHEGFNCDIGKRYKMKINIYKDRADYSIDGNPYAYAYFPEKGNDSIPQEGYFGFAIVEKGEHKVIENVVITEMKEEQNHKICYTSVPNDFKLDDDSEQPQNKFLVNATYDDSEKNFKGRIDWRPNSFENGYM